MSEIGTNTGVYGTTEADAWALIPEEVSREVVSGVVEGSAALSMFRKLPNMSSRTYRMPVLDAIGAAYFTGSTTSDNLIVGADTQVDDTRQAALKAGGYVPETDFPGQKKTHQMEWANVYINAEPIAIMLPIPEDALDDAGYPIFEEMRPKIIEAFYNTIDDAIIWGQLRPQSWPTGIVPTAINRGFTHEEGDGLDLAGDISDTMALIEAYGYDASGFIAHPSFKAKLRNLRDTQRGFLFQPSMQSGTPDSLFGQPIMYNKNGSFRDTIAQLIVGDMSQAVYSVRMDMRWKLITEGVITDADNDIVINLAQQDSVAMRVVMRLGWAVPNPIHALGTRATRYPFAVMTTNT